MLMDCIRRCADIILLLLSLVGIIGKPVRSISINRSSTQYLDLSNYFLDMISLILKRICSANLGNLCVKLLKYIRSTLHICSPGNIVYWMHIIFYCYLYILVFILQNMNGNMVTENTSDLSCFRCPYHSWRRLMVDASR